MGKPIKYDPLSAKAKDVCRLNMEDIRMAKALGMSAKSLMKNNPNPAQRWKLPVKYWIRELYEKRFGRNTELAPKSSQPPSDAGVPEAVAFDEDIPF